MSETRAASCSLASHTPSLVKLGPAIATALKRVQECSYFSGCSCPQRSRAIGAVKTEVVLTVVRGTEGTSRSCLNAALVVGLASGVSGDFSLLTLYG